MAHHNAALFLFDHIHQMLRKSFPDSEIAKSYHCARTKVACIFNYALANELIDDMKKQSYSLSIDASNDSEVLFHSIFFKEIHVDLLVLMLQSQVDFSDNRWNFTMM